MMQIRPYLFLLVSVLLFSFFFAASPRARAEGFLTVSIGQETTFVEGFPLVLRLTFHGPLTASDVTLLDNNASIRVTMTNKANGKQYVLASSRGTMRDPVVGGHYVGNGDAPTALP